MQNTVINVEKLFFAYDKNWVLEDVNFSISQGEFVTIVGPNGGGKSTLLRLLLGFEHPNQGSISFPMALSGSGGKIKRPLIGHMPQHLKVDLLFPATVYDVILSGRNFRFFPTKEDRLQTEAIISDLNLVELSNERFSDLSGGHRQKVLVARALVLSPDILTLDEPTNHLDQNVETHFWALLKERHKKMTTLLVSHELLLVSAFTQKALCVNKSVQVHKLADLNSTNLERIFQGQAKIIDHSSDKHCCHEEGCQHLMKTKGHS